MRVLDNGSERYRYGSVSLSYIRVLDGIEARALYYDKAGESNAALHLNSLFQAIKLSSGDVFCKDIIHL